MPHVSVKMWTGRTEKQKQELTEKITQAIKDVTGVKEHWISVAIEEYDPSDWAKVFTEEIEPKGDKLYKKPGYTLDDLKN